jgi:hypothetical protein
MFPPAFVTTFNISFKTKGNHNKPDGSAGCTITQPNILPQKAYFVNQYNLYLGKKTAGF